MKTRNSLCTHTLLIAMSTLAPVYSSGFPRTQESHPLSAANRAAPNPQGLAQGTPVASAATKIAEVKIARGGEQTIVRVEGKGRLTCRTQRLDNPERLVLDFSGARLALSQTSIPSTLAPVRRVRLGQFKPDVTRVVIDLERAVPYRVTSEDQSVTVLFSATTTAPTSSHLDSQTPADQERNAIHARRSEAVRPASGAALDPSHTPAPQSSAQAAAASGPPVLPEAKAQSSENTVRDGMLSFHAQNRPVRSIVEQIADKAHLPIILAADLGGERISVQFEHYRLDEALRQILKDYDVFFFYSADDYSKINPPSLKSVWVYPASRARGFEPAPPDSWAKNTQELERMLSEPDPEVRARGIEAVIRRKGSHSADAVLEALRDTDQEVRSKALYRALSSGVEIPQELLIDLALHDESMNVRFLALQALPVDPKFRWVAERALGDPSSYVGRMAEKILSELDAPNAPATPRAANQTKPPGR